MIVALIVVDRISPVIQGHAPYALPFGAETVIERVVRTVLRGPFGGVLVAAPHGHREPLAALLKGFAVQIVAAEAPPGAEPQPLAVLSAGLAAAAGFRERWERAMSVAAARFSVSEHDEVQKTTGPQKGGAQAQHAPPGPDDTWVKPRKTPDVKMRGLARSFERDGVMVFRADRPLIRLDLQAQVVETFGRDASGISGKLVAIKATEVEGKISTGRRCAQAVYHGQRGYPVVMCLDAADEIRALPPTADFDAWLAQNPSRIRDAHVDDPGAVEGINSEADYQRLLAKLPK